MNKLSQEEAFIIFKNILGDIECGYFHSGFKPCCVAYYSVVSNLSWYFYRPLYDWIRYFNRAIEVKRGSYFGYIPCPKCLLLNQKVEVKRCRKLVKNKSKELKKHLFKLTLDENVVGQKISDRFNSNYNDELYRKLRLVEDFFRKGVIK